jgi:hypothetical protein
MRAKTSPQRVVLRSRICLLAAERLPNNASAHRWEPDLALVLWTPHTTRQEVSMNGNRRVFTPEFKQEAVTLVQ